jgi:uncharacterized repeat protein (TIGR03803 family)
MSDWRFFANNLQTPSYRSTFLFGILLYIQPLKAGSTSMVPGRSSSPGGYVNNTCAVESKVVLSAATKALGCGIVLLALCVFATSANAQSYKVIYSFTGGADGGGPLFSPLVRVSGNLYGTTGLGGSSNNGTLFKVTPQGQETVLHSFTGSDGRGPSGLTRDSSGNFFGVTGTGGPAGACNNPFEPNGCGVVFEFTTAGKLRVLFAFSGASGMNPGGKLTFDSKGNLFGVTAGGGSNPSCTGDRYQTGCGTVFELTPAGTKWNETVLYSFGGGSDGFDPSGVTLYKGKLFGNTSAGNGLPCDSGVCGTVFELTPSQTGWMETILHSFSGGGDGAIVEDGLRSDADGNFYGTTYFGGDSGFGTVFKIDASGQKTTLYSFKGTDGAYPAAGVVRDKDGNLFGTTTQGGSSKVGTVFELDTSNHFTVLHSFTGGNDGAYPYSALLLSGKFLYGTTVAGGPSNWGTVFKVEK